MSQTYERCTMVLSMLIGLTASGILTASEPFVFAAEPDRSMLESGQGLIRNVEDMVAHGGMGDAKAIVHHCGEASRYAETLIKQLSASNPNQIEAVGSLNDVIRHCKRVSEIGAQVDPGVLLNPAVKARAAAQASVKALGLAK
jgi:hypothetical protein